MREIAVTIAENTTAADLLSSLAKGETKLHTQRENGTFRRVHFLAEGTEARELAEFIVALREGNEEEDRAPLSMKAIARKVNLSVASVRRMINDLLLTQELEEMDEAELDDLLNGGEEAEDTMVVTEDGDDSEGNE